MFLMNMCYFKTFLISFNISVTSGKKCGRLYIIRTADVQHGTHVISVLVGTGSYMISVDTEGGHFAVKTLHWNLE